MTAKPRTSFLVLVMFAALSAIMTWPHVRHLGSQVPDADDPLLSIWRLSWIAHALPNDPVNLLNGNIFYPEARTLAFTDAVLLQGFAASPFIWLGASPIVVYNVMILASIALSGWTMWIYAQYLTGSTTAALLAGVIFAFAPFRFDHYHHLELQATFFMPLALYWFERAVDTGTRRYVWKMAAALVAQVYCGIYYAVFLLTALAVAVPLRLPGLSRDRLRSLLRAAIPAAVVAALVTGPYLSVYLANRSVLGDRQDQDIESYSAVLSNYLATSSENALYGERTAGLGKNERRLFLGFTAMALAAVGMAQFEKRRLMLVVIGAMGLAVSLGFNTPAYDLLREVLFVYRGLRVPARASILLLLAIAPLAAYGWTSIDRRLAAGGGITRSTLVRAVSVSLVAALMLLEYATVLRAWFNVSPEPPAVYRWLAGQPRSVIAELPMTTADRLNANLDSLYMFQSRHHWYPIVNGYSGFYPPSYLELIERMRTFPDEASIQYLRKRNVDLIVIHGGRMTPDAFGQTTAVLVGRNDLEVASQFDGEQGRDVVFRLIR